MKARHDWSEERVRDAVSKSVSIPNCLRLLGIDPKKGFSQFKRIIKKYNIDISHFIKLHNRTNNGITQICSKCGIEKPLSAFYKKARNKTGIMSICKQCCTSTYGRGRAKKDKLYWLTHYGGKCQHCGIKVNEDNYVIFDFHHLDPKDKEKGPNYVYRYGKETARKELDKCIILCANCHRLEHHKLKLKEKEHEEG